MILPGRQQTWSITWGSSSSKWYSPSFWESGVELSQVGVNSPWEPNVSNLSKSPRACSPCYDWPPISGWWFFASPTPLKNDGVSNSWDDDIPYMKWKIKFMFQTTNQICSICCVIKINSWGLRMDIKCRLTFLCKVTRWFLKLFP